MKDRVLRFLSGTVLLAVALTGCTGLQNSGNSDSGPVYVSHQEAVQLYYKRRAELVLPDNVVWNSELPFVLQDDSPGHYFAESVGGQEAELQWYCIWAQHALKTNIKEDFMVLAGIKNMVVYEKADEVTRDIFNSIQDDLIAYGQTESLVEYVSINCR